MQHLSFACVVCKATELEFSSSRVAMARVKKHKTLDFATNLKTIQGVEACEKCLAVADDFGIPRSAPSILLKNKADIRADVVVQRHWEPVMCALLPTDM